MNQYHFLNYIASVLISLGSIIIYNQMTYIIADSFPLEKRGFALSIVCVVNMLCGLS